MISFKHVLSTALLLVATTVGVNAMQHNVRIDVYNHHLTPAAKAEVKKVLVSGTVGLLASAVVKYGLHNSGAGLVGMLVGGTTYGLTKLVNACKRHNVGGNQNWIAHVGAPNNFIFQQ